MNPFMQFLQQIRTAMQQSKQLSTPQQNQVAQAGSHIPFQQPIAPQSGLVQALAQYGGMPKGQTGQLMTPQSLMILHAFPQLANQVNARMIQPAQQMMQRSAGILGGQSPVGQSLIGRLNQQPQQLPTLRTSTGEPYLDASQPKQPAPEEVRSPWSQPMGRQNQLANTPVGGRNAMLPSTGMIPANFGRTPSTIPLQGSTI